MDKKLRVLAKKESNFFKKCGWLFAEKRETMKASANAYRGESINGTIKTGMRSGIKLGKKFYKTGYMFGEVR